MAVYPRKQTFVILIVCILFVGGMSFYVRGDFLGVSLSHSARISSQTLPVSLTVSQQPSFKETTDWRKQFLDKDNSSADLKGMAKASPAQKEAPLNATDILGRIFMNKYSELHESGLNTDPSSVDSVMNQASKEALATLPQPKSFTLADVKVAANTNSALVEYSRAITQSFTAYNPKQNEAQIANEALAENDLGSLAKIDPIISDYKTLLASLAAIPTPSPLVKNHVDLLNSVSLALNNAEALRHIDTDPVRGLAGVSLGVAALQNIASALNTVNDYLASMGVRTNS